MGSDALLNSLSDIEAIALTIFGEARGEPIEGQIAVGCVIRNRFYDNPGRYRFYKDVCLEAKQFSCWNLNDPNYELLKELALQQVNGQNINDIHYRQAVWVAQGITSQSLLDNTHGAKHYLTKALFSSDKRPEWADSIKQAITLGKQVFFNI